MESINIQPIETIIKDIVSKDEFEKYFKIGVDAIKNRQLAVCTLAGGQGTRLGHDGPKGTFMLNFSDGSSKSIFEIIAEILKNNFKKYGVYLDWYIMTSKQNNKETNYFFEKNNYFDLPKENIVFFVQGELPLTTRDKKEIKDSNNNIIMAANGNGGIFKALEDENILKRMHEKNIDYICSCNVDNILINPIDEFSIGYLVDNKIEIGIKSILKTNPEEKVGNIVLKNGKPTVIEYIDFEDKYKNEKLENGNLKYSEAHFGCNYLKINLLDRIAEEKLPLHEAYKSNTEYGDYIKYEMFIFDGFEKANSGIVIRVNREDEFAPIKNKEGNDSPETAIKLYENKNMK